jgi:hypothetical protein
MPDGLVINFRLPAPCDPVEEKGGKASSGQLFFYALQGFPLLRIKIFGRRVGKENIPCRVPQNACVVSLEDPLPEPFTQKIRTIGEPGTQLLGKDSP